MEKTKIKIGIDEAGRGAWAGPVVACAFAWNPWNIPKKEFLLSLRDSKKLSAKKRTTLYEELITLSAQENMYFGVGVVDNFVIDEMGIKKANKEAMRRAIIEIQRKIPAAFENISVIIDGNDNYTFDELENPPLYLIGGDTKVPEISAASIIAKVFRDRLMKQYSSLYPNYGFDTHVAYGTKKHRSALDSGKKTVTGIHRTSYKPLKNLLEKKEKVLVHICCGPDATVPLMDLKKDYEVIAYWYDPNIQPAAEHEKRFDAFVKVCKIEGVSYIRGEYDVKNFFKKIKGLEHTPERGEKCRECYDMRLERSAKLAREMGIKKWTSSLNNSPHKDMEKMFGLGEKWDRAEYISLSPILTQEERSQAAEILQIPYEEYTENVKKLEEQSSTQTKENTQLQEKLDFLKIAFRKNGGFQRSVDYTHEHNIFRQNYCGCVYSDTFPGREKPGSKKGFTG